MIHSLKTMFVIFISLLVLACGAEAEDSTLASSTGELTADEKAALDQCIKDITECRKNATTEEESQKCRLLAECLPERPEKLQGGDLATFCDGVDERCKGGDMDAAECEKLKDRCLMAEAQQAGSGNDSQAPFDPEECMKGCLASGAPQSACDERCGG